MPKEEIVAIYILYSVEVSLSPIGTTEEKFSRKWEKVMAGIAAIRRGNSRAKKF
jgi:hypothetical protein